MQKRSEQFHLLLKYTVTQTRREKHLNREWLNTSEEKASNKINCTKIILTYLLHGAESFLRS